MGKIFDDPEMERVWREYVDAMGEYGIKLKELGKRSPLDERFYEEADQLYKDVVAEKAAAYYGYQTLKLLDVVMTPVKEKGE